jgi:hypothetical protein
MTVGVVHHRDEFDAWKPVLHEHASSRRCHRGARHCAHRMVDDPNDVVAAVAFQSEEGARAFLEDPASREAMERAGVEGEPHVHCRARVEAVDY